LLGLQIVLILVWSGGANATANSDDGKALSLEGADSGEKDVYLSHSCIHDEILHQRRRAGRKEYSVMPQVYHVPRDKTEHLRGRQLLGVSSWRAPRSNVKKPIRIYLNYDAVGHSPDRDCKNVGDVVKVGLSQKPLLMTTAALLS
jgi:leishmanolysin